LLYNQKTHDDITDVRQQVTVAWRSAQRQVCVIHNHKSFATMAHYNIHAIRPVIRGANPSWKMFAPWKNVLDIV